MGKLEKFMEDVKFGIYPLTAFALAVPPPAKTEPPSPELHRQKTDKLSEEESQDEENRRICSMQCSIQPGVMCGQMNLRILLRMEDNMNRQLSCTLNTEDNPDKLAHELVQYGFIHPLDSKCIQGML